MRQFQRLIALAALAGFIGITLAEASHGHRSTQPTTTCAVCKIGETARTATQAPDIGLPEITVWVLAPTPAPRPDLAFVFDPHGLSPPFQSA